MERISLQGDFFDCQLYGGRLYLWTFKGSLQVYNYSAIVRDWVYRRGRIDNRCQAYEDGLSQIYIDNQELHRCLVDERDYLTDEFPTGTEILAGELYESNVKGLFRCKVPLFKEMMPVEKISDVPLVYVSGAQRRGLACAGGSDGMFWRPSGMKENGLLHVSNRQTIRASFCGPGIYAQSSVGDSYLLVNERGIFDTIISGIDLFHEAGQRVYGKKMTWSWNNDFYIADNHSLKIYEYVSATKPMKLKEEIRFYYWKGDFVSAGSSYCGTVIELDNAICLLEDLQQEDARCTIMGPVTRWRMYPRSKGFSSHVHIIFDDRMDIVVMNDDVRNWYERRRFL